MLFFVTLIHKFYHLDKIHIIYSLNGKCMFIRIIVNCQLVTTLHSIRAHFSFFMLWEWCMKYMDYYFIFSHCFFGDLVKTQKGLNIIK